MNEPTKNRRISEAFARRERFDVSRTCREFLALYVFGALDKIIPKKKRRGGCAQW